jgi:hypothetical protein
MGQQQLLLLVMGIVLVAVAVMGGFVAFQESMRKNEADALVDYNLGIATDAIFWKAKFDPFAGGNASYTGLEDGGMKKLFRGDSTYIGRFKITLAQGDELQITAVSLRYPDIGARTYVLGQGIDSTSVSYEGRIDY